MSGYFAAIEELTVENSFFRRVIFTAKHSQLVLMCLQPNEEIGRELHAEVDQFFRIEQGDARFVLGDDEEHLVHAGDAVVVPARTAHNVINASQSEPLKLYTIYSPPNHPEGTLHRTKAEAEMAEAAHA